MNLSTQKTCGWRAWFGRNALLVPVPIAGRRPLSADFLGNPAQHPPHQSVPDFGPPSLPFPCFRHGGPAHARRSFHRPDSAGCRPIPEDQQALCRSRRHREAWFRLRPHLPDHFRHTHPIRHFMVPRRQTHASGDPHHRGQKKEALVVARRIQARMQPPHRPESRLKKPRLEARRVISHAPRRDDGEGRGPSTEEQRRPVENGPPPTGDSSRYLPRSHTLPNYHTPFAAGPGLSAGS
jgi:hypothetical protein